MPAKPPRSILFVCLGNICRSPLAEGIFRAVLGELGAEPDFVVDSAGTGAWHVGSPPDPRSVAVASRHSVDISSQRARKVTAADFDRFDLILGMDQSNVAELCRHAPAAGRGKVHLFLEYATGLARDVPDPYHGGPDGFGEVYRMIRDASEALAGRLDARASTADSGHASSTM